MGTYGTEYHRNLLGGLRDLIGCDNALFRPGSRWPGAQAIYLEDDQRFTDDYVRQADVYRPEVARWCQLSQGDRAIIDTEIYSVAERRQKALYAQVIHPAGVKSIMGCPLKVGETQVGLVFLYRTGRHATPFAESQARALDPILKAMALAEIAREQAERRQTLERVTAELPPRLHGVFDLSLKGKSEKEIAFALGLSPRTVHKYSEQIYRILNVHSRGELLARVLG